MKKKLAQFIDRYALVVLLILFFTVPSLLSFHYSGAPRAVFVLTTLISSVVIYILFWNLGVWVERNK